MPRTDATAAILIQALRPAAVRYDERLSPKETGYLSGHDRLQIERDAALAGIPVHLFKTPGGESTVEVQRRHVDLWHKVSVLPGTHVLVGHGVGIVTLLLHLTGDGFERFPDYIHGSAYRTIVDVEYGRHRIVELNKAPGWRARGDPADHHAGQHAPGAHRDRVAGRDPAR